MDLKGALHYDIKLHLEIVDGRARRIHHSAPIIPNACLVLLLFHP